MRRIEEPTRLLDPRSGASADVRRVLAEGRDALEPTQAELARLEAFVAGVGVGAGGLAAGKLAAVRAGSHAITKAGVVKLAALLVGSGLAAGIGWTELHRGEAPSAVAVLPASSVTAPAMQTSASPREAPPVTPDDTPSAPPQSVTPPPSVATARPSAAPSLGPTALPPDVTTPPVPAAISPPGSPASSRSAAGESELALLERARTKLAVDPARALGVLDEHRARYAGGTFAQEREVLAIEALVRLGRRHDARARADAFTRAFPGSAHRRRIAVLLGEDGGE